MLTEERMSTFPEEVLEHVLAFLTSHKDRNSVSLVCKAWYMIEALSRQHVFIGNCYAISPMSLTYRFKNLKSLSIKGKPRFSDFGLVPAGWGAHVHPWIVALANSYPWLEELRLKRMVVSDDALALLASSFLNFQVLVLTSCDGFTTDGLIPIAATCRHLAELELQECIITDTGGQWLSYFPESCTSLVSLNFSCTSSEVNFTALEKLVTRCTSLKSLKVNHAVSLKQLGHLLLKAPQLIDLGTGSLSIEKGTVDILRFKSAVANCKGLQSLSGFWEVSPLCLPFLYPICGNLTSLNLSYACTLQSSDMIRLISLCYHLKRLWVLDCVEDTGLQATAATCKALEELRVFPGMGQRSVTEEGLVSVSKGCPQMTSILYFCGQMTNSALECVANNLPQLICFRLCILDPYKPDHLTKGPFDEGFGAVVKNCKNLKRFSLSGLLTDKAFEYIGSYGKELEMLSLAFAGESDFGMQLILKGCQKLRILEIRDSPFGDAALLYGWQKYLSMRSLWMSSCKVTVAGCHLLARNMPCLNVEIIKEDPTDPYAEKLYVYRTVAGPRTDAADFVWTC